MSEENQIVYVLFTCHLKDEGENRTGEYPNDEDDWDDYFEGAFSSFEKAAKYLPSAIDEELTPDKLNWQSGEGRLCSRKRYRTNIVESTFYMIKECEIDVGEWTGLVRKVLSANGAEG